MNKTRILGAVAVLALKLAGCGAATGSDSARFQNSGKSGKLRIKFVINGNLGDRSFFDSAYAGLKKTETKWSSGFEDAAAGDDYDVLAAGTVVLPGSAGNGKAGVIGGVKIPVIDGGPVQYVGGDNPFGDPAKGKQIASAMYGKGAELVWPVAGSSGLGAFEQAVAISSVVSTSAPTRSSPR